MSEWTIVCTHVDCRNRANPATDRWESKIWGVLYYCRKHSAENGPFYKALGYKWSKLPERTQAQPSSERE